VATKAQRIKIVTERDDPDFSVQVNRWEERSITTTPSTQELKAALSAFKKRLKPTCRNDQSSDIPLNHHFFGIAATRGANRSTF